MAQCEDAAYIIWRYVYWMCRGCVQIGQLVVFRIEWLNIYGSWQCTGTIVIRVAVIAYQFVYLCIFVYICVYFNNIMIE